MPEAAAKGSSRGVIWLRLRSVVRSIPISATLQARAVSEKFPLVVR